MLEAKYSERCQQKQALIPPNEKEKVGTDLAGLTIKSKVGKIMKKQTRNWTGMTLGS